MATMAHLLFNRRDALCGLTAASILGPTGCLAGSPTSGSLLDYIPAGQHRAIAMGRSEYDCAPDLQRALRETAPAGAILMVPEGIYMLGPAHRLNHADRNFECLAAVRIVSGMRLAGEAGAVLRIVGGHSSDRRPRAMVMFGADDRCADIAISGLVLDMNGRQNPISPGRREGRYNRFPQAQIFVSSRGAGPPARIDRVRISDTEFRDSNGVSCIVMAQNEDRSAALGRDWTLERCAFRENGLDTDDHSSVFAYADQVTVSQCQFANAAPYGRVGVNTGYEVHGSDQRIIRSRFDNALRGIWVANNYASTTRGTVIENNDFSTLFYGVDFFHDRASARPVRETTIRGNRFRFDDRRIASAPRLDMKAAVQVASEFAQQDIIITGNTVVKSGHAVTSAFLVVTGGAQGALRHDAITASDNSGSGLTFGTFLRTTPTAGFGRLTLVRNRWSDLAPSSLMQIAAGDAVERTGASQPIASLTLGGGTAQPAAGRGAGVREVFINTTIERLHSLSRADAGTKGHGIELGGAGRILSRN